MNYIKTCWKKWFFSSKLSCRIFPYSERHLNVKNWLEHGIESKLNHIKYVFQFGMTSFYSRFHISTPSTSIFALQCYDLRPLEWQVCGCMNGIGEVRRLQTVYIKHSSGAKRNKRVPILDSGKDNKLTKQINEPTNKQAYWEMTRSDHQIHR